jgi:carbon storage regulator
MLRISRRAGERIMLGDDTVIEILEVRGQTVRIGIDAPRSVPVYREEIWLEVKKENQAAAEAAASAELPDVSGRLDKAPPSGAADHSNPQGA